MGAQAISSQPRTNKAVRTAGIRPKASQRCLMLMNTIW
jgi:hypothetical protein